MSRLRCPIVSLSAGRRRRPLAGPGLLGAVVLIAAFALGCGPGEGAGPRLRLDAGAISVTLDGKATFALPGAVGGDPTLGVPRAVDGPVSRAPLLRFAAGPDAGLGPFSHAIVSLRDLGPAPDRFAPGGGLTAAPPSPAGDLVWYVETRRQGSAIFPGQPLDLSRPASPNIRIESDRHGEIPRVLFYPGTLYELVVTYVGSKGLASQLIRFTVAP